MVSDMGRVPTEARPGPGPSQGHGGRWGVAVSCWDSRVLFTGRVGWVGARSVGRSAFRVAFGSWGAPHIQWDWGYRQSSGGSPARITFVGHAPVVDLHSRGSQRSSWGDGERATGSGPRPSPRSPQEGPCPGSRPAGWLLFPAASAGCSSTVLIPRRCLVTPPVPPRPSYSHQRGPQT